jgi:TrmH family RNA methyltransferase
MKPEIKHKSQNILKIESIDNSLVKEISKLKDKKNRNINQLFIAEGERVIKTFLESGFEPHHYFCLDPKKILWPKAIITTEKVIKKMSSLTTPCGHLAVFKMPCTNSENISSGIVAAQINDPGNIGTLLRSTAAFGFKTAILIESCDPWSPKVVQSSAGALTKLNLVISNWTELVNNCQQQNIKLIGLVVDSDKFIDNLKSDQVEKYLLVIGNEANGIPKPWLNNCDQLVTIPMKNDIESLNAAIAGSIALFIMSKKNR